jgi:hypothetical protein
MPGYRANTKEERPKDQTSEEKLPDGTTITVTRTHHRVELLADILDDFPDEIKKIVTPFI